MKKTFFIFATILVACALNAQQSSKKRPIPDWLFELPKATFSDMHFDRVQAFGTTKEEAYKKACTMAFDKESSRLSKPMNMEDVAKAVDSGTTIQVLGQKFALPLRFFDPPFYREEEIGWSCTILYEVGQDCNVDISHFDNYNPNQFSKYIAWKLEKEAEAEQRRQDSLQIVKSNNAKALAASTFIPGMGQMLKGQYGAGCGFLFGELALFGGGTACYFLADKQNDIMTKRGTSYDDYTAAKNKKNSYNIAMYCCFGAGVALHIVNMCHAYMCFDKKLAKRLSAFEPAIIPINEYSQPNYALGISWHHEF